MPLVPVNKKDGRTRGVTDLRELTKQTFKDIYPLTNTYAGDLAQSARCYRVFIFRCLWSLSCRENQR